MPNAHGSRASLYCLSFSLLPLLFGSRVKILRPAPLLTPVAPLDCLPTQNSSILLRFSLLV